ncbi:MAG: hypothetical protein LBE71_01365 [Dysgonamonadaceae bacterium]|jgi:hypothetical protein|nr:hypothetical protein [Dysgonamonadaceae bacterium]
MNRHTLTVTDKVTFNKWKNGELRFNPVSGNFIGNFCYSEENYREYVKYNHQELKNGFIFNNTFYENLPDIPLATIPKEDVVKWFSNQDNDNALTYTKWTEAGEYSHYSKEYTSPSGDELVIFGKYTK